MKYKIILYIAILCFSSVAYAQEKPEPAGKVMDDAYKTAKAQNKSVMVVFHASWCSWCKKFEASVNDPLCKSFFEKHFVIKYLDILEHADKKNLENQGADELYTRYGGKNQGVPYFLVFDKNGKLLADSKVKAAGDGPEKPAMNIGCPASADEVAAFIKILEKAEKISDADKAAISERFKKNK